MSPDENKIGIPFNLICPECGVGNPEGSERCLVCDRNLENIVAYMEDDSFDLEVTGDFLIEYRKNFWGDRRTGKKKRYRLDKMENLEFGYPITRFIFYYEGKREVIALRKENLEKLKQVLKNWGSNEE